MKRSFVPALLLALILAAAPTGAAAAQPTEPGRGPVAPAECDAGTGRGGAAALAALVAAAVNVGNVSACVLNDSLNYLLQNADIDVLNNILNNSPILNDLTVTITGVSVLDNNTVTVSLLSGGVTIPVVIAFP